MSDIVECKTVLVTHVSGNQSLYLAVKPDFKLRIIPVRPKGDAKKEPERPGWEYEIQGEKLKLCPSLHCIDTGFHTAFDWECRFVPITANSGYEKFYEENPEIEK